MQYILHILLSATVVVLIYLSVHYSFMHRLLDKWHEVDRKTHIVVLATICGVVVISVLVWNILGFI